MHRTVQPLQHCESLVGCSGVSWDVSWDVAAYPGRTHQVSSHEQMHKAGGHAAREGTAASSGFGKQAVNQQFLILFKIFNEWL